MSPPARTAAAACQDGRKMRIKVTTVEFTNLPPGLKFRR